MSTHVYKDLKIYMYSPAWLVGRASTDVISHKKVQSKNPDNVQCVNSMVIHYTIVFKKVVN